MPAYPLPAADVNQCSGWTEQDRDAYNFLPYYMVKQQIKYRNQWTRWPKMTGTIKWQPNMGSVMRGVRQEPSPVIRQTAFPANLTGAARKDIIDTREVANTTQVMHQKFESPIFQFYSSFRDFMNDHVLVNGKDIIQKQTVFEDVFLRTAIFHYAPNMYIPGIGMIGTPTGVGNAAGTSAKTTGTLQQIIAQIPANTPGLGLAQINLATTMTANDLAIPPFTGMNDNQEISKAGLQEKYVLITSSEAYNQFFFDPWLLAHKNCQLDVLTSAFRGNLFGQVTCSLERWPLRMAADGTFPAPEIRVLGVQNNGANGASDNVPYNVNETIPNPAYVQAPIEFAFLCGDSGYDSITVGPPPKVFAGNGMPDGFGKMTWNGELILTKNLNIPCYDDAGNLMGYEPNAYGEFIRYISHVVYGIMPTQRRNVIPIPFIRKRGV